MRRNNKKGKLPRKRQFTPVLHRKKHTRRSFIRSFCVCLDGVPDRTRTCNRQNRNLKLYPIALRVRAYILYSVFKKFSSVGDNFDKII